MSITTEQIQDVYPPIRRYRDEIHRRVCNQFPFLKSGITVCVTVEVDTAHDSMRLNASVHHEILRLNPGGYGCLIGYGNGDEIVDNTVKTACDGLSLALAVQERIIKSSRSAAEDINVTSDVPEPQRSE